MLNNLGRTLYIDSTFCPSELCKIGRKFNKYCQTKMHITKYAITNGNKQVRFWTT